MPEEIAARRTVHRQVKAQALRHRLRLEEAGGQLFPFTRLPVGAAREQPRSSACTTLLWTLLASGQVAMRKVDG
jgi:hypothetical protein